MRTKPVLLFGFLLLFFLPSQLGFHFWPDSSKFGSLRIDYLSPTILFSDLLCLLFIFVSKPKLSQKLFLIPALNSIYSLHPPTVLYHWLRIILYLLVAQSFIRYLPLFKKYWLSALSLSVLWVSVLAILQFIIKSSLGGVWYWLGERPLSISLPYISKIFIPDFGYFLRSYATFPHPNALAGYLLIAGIVIYLNHSKLGNWKQLSSASLLVGFFGLLFTFSKTVFFPLAFFLPKDQILQSWHERSLLLNNYLQIIPDYLLTGVGLGAYPMAAIRLSSSSLQLSYQPVHNVFLLLVAELGLPLFITVIYLFIKKQKTVLVTRNWLLIIAILITSSIDHYWLTSKSNFLLLMFVWALLKSSGVTNQNDSQKHRLSTSVKNYYLDHRNSHS